MEGERHLVSVAVPTFRRAASLDHVLGVLARDPVGRALPIVVSDNASPDATPDVIARRRADLPRLGSVRQATNIGPAGNV